MKDAGQASTLRAWRDVPDASLRQRNLGLALIAVGESQRSTEQINRGYRLLSEVFPKYRKDPEVLAALGMVLFLKDRYKDACLLLEEAISIRPRYAPLYEKLAVVYRASGDIEKARQALEKAIELEPVSESAYHMLANLSATPEERKQALHRYLNVVPQSLLAREALRPLPGR
jgi:Flp pilus assembly protein TadD